jgi:class 3 adenylate cyclase
MRVRDSRCRSGARLQIRAGVHTGEIEVRGSDIAGIAVHVGQRVASQAGPGDVFISTTVADLIAGSDIELLDQGEHQLKGVSGASHLFSVRA